MLDEGPDGLADGTRIGIDGEWVSAGAWPDGSVADEAAGASDGGALGAADVSADG